MSIFSSDALKDYLKKNREEKELCLKELFNHNLKGLRYFIDKHPSLSGKYNYESYPNMTLEDLDIISENTFEIKSIDRSISQYDGLCKWNEVFERKANKCVDSTVAEMECYYYDIMYTNAERIDSCRPLEFTIWQHFAFGFYPKDNIVFEPSLHSIYERSKQLYKQHSSSVWDAFFNQLLNLKKSFGSISILWGKSRSAMDIVAIKHQFRYIRSKLSKNNIQEFFIRDINDIPKNSNIVVVDYILSISELKLLSIELISKLANITPFISFLTFQKEYDLKEAIELNEDARAKKAKNQKPKDLKTYYRSVLKKLEKCTMRWEEKVKEIPFQYLVDYYPSSYKTYEISEDDAINREVIWDFKNSNNGVDIYDHGEVLAKIISKIADELIVSFGILLNHLTLVCVPASNENDYEIRYKEFSSMLCRLTGIENSFNEIAYLSNGSPKHLGGNEYPDILYNPDFFEGRFIILFDDVVTTGRTIDRTKKALEKVKAHVIGAITIGRTVRTMK